MGTEDKVSPQMRSRLLANRRGKLTTEQWKDAVTEPLGVLLLLLAPAIIILGPRMLLLSARGIVVVLAGIVVLVALPMVLRAWRYARAPLYFDKFYAGDYPAPSWVFWRPQVFYTENGEAIQFKKRLAPRVRLRANRAYIVYYLRESDHCVLLSLAPADHVNADKWQPDDMFYNRQAQRTNN